MEKFYIKKKFKLLWRTYLFAHNKTMSLMFNVYWSMKKVSAILKFLPNAHVWKICGEFLIWQPPIINKSFIPFHKTKFNQEVLHWFPWLSNYLTWSENAYHCNLNIQPQVRKRLPLQPEYPTSGTITVFVYMLLPIHTTKVTDNRLLRKFQNVY